MIELREYQKEAIRATYEYWRSGKGISPVIDAAPAAGKSLIMAKITKDLCSLNKCLTILMLCHVKELVLQNSNELKEFYPECDIGIYSAGLGKRDTKNQVIFAGIQSYYDKKEHHKHFDLILIDECEQAATSDKKARYSTLISSLKNINPKLRILGLTGTPYRSSGYIYENNPIFDGLAYTIGYKELLELGYVLPVISKSGVKNIDLKNVSIKSGEYAIGELAEAATNPELIKSVVSEVIQYGHNRKSWLVFATSIDHAESLKVEFVENGIDANVVSGKTPTSIRDNYIESFKNLGFRCLINVGVLVAGFNSPKIDLLAIARSTLSTRIFVQMVGRLYRLYNPLDKLIENHLDEKKKILFTCRSHEDADKVNIQLIAKGISHITASISTDTTGYYDFEYNVEPNMENGLLLDFGSNVQTHGMIDDIEPIISGGNKTIKDKLRIIEESPKIKECDECKMIVKFESMVCDCGYKFPIRALTHSKHSYDFENECERYTVINVIYSRHKKPDKPDSLKVNYLCHGNKQFSEWLCIEHGGMAGSMAKGILKVIGSKSLTVDDFLSDFESYKKPYKISVSTDKQYPKILRRSYN
jgi:DNA repair protein RadD